MRKIGMVCMSLVWVMVMYLPALAATPPKDFLNTSITSDMYIPLQEFISPGLKPGVWEKDAQSNSWIYRVTVVDSLTKKKTTTSFLFEKTVEENKPVILLKRVVANEANFDARQRQELFNKIIVNTPSFAKYKMDKAKQEAQNEKTEQAEIAKKNASNLWGVYTSKNEWETYKNKKVEKIELNKKITITNLNSMANIKYSSDFNGKSYCKFELSIKDYPIKSSCPFDFAPTS
jgi:hypothetical protein